MKKRKYFKSKKEIKRGAPNQDHSHNVKIKHMTNANVKTQDKSLEIVSNNMKKRRTNLVALNTPNYRKAEHH